MAPNQTSWCDLFRMTINANAKIGHISGTMPRTATLPSASAPPVAIISARTAMETATAAIRHKGPAMRNVVNARRIDAFAPVFSSLGSRNIRSTPRRREPGCQAAKSKSPPAAAIAVFAATATPQAPAPAPANIAARTNRPQAAKLSAAERPDRPHETRSSPIPTAANPLPSQMNDASLIRNYTSKCH